MINYTDRVLGDLFNNPIKGEHESYFRVPQFQRKYEWEKEKEVGRLIEDVFDNLGRTYFVGPLIFYSDPDELYVEIIDGQQRLVTFALFYRAFVDYVQKRINEGGFTEDLIEDAREIQHLLKGLIIRGQLKKKEAVVNLSKKIDGFFREEIIVDDYVDKIERLKAEAKGKHPSIKRLVSAYTKLFESLAELCDSLEGMGLLNKLRNICDALIYRQIFITIVVQDYTDAFTVFETMNERGKRLTLSDLVKNLSFNKIHVLGEVLLDQFEENWDVAELLVSDFGSFIWHAWVSRYGTCPKTRIFREIGNYVSKMSPGDVFDFCYALIFDEAPWYHTYENPRVIVESNDTSREKKRYLEMLEAMGATRCYPLLLSIDYCENKGNINPNQSNEIIKAIACLTFWHSGICGKDAKQLERIYHNLAQKVRKLTKEDSGKSVLNVIDELHKVFPRFDECKSSFITSTFSDDKFIKMMLRTIEATENPGEKALQSDSIVWLEHVLPKNPSLDSAWLEIFPDERERGECTFKLGNCTLLLNRLNVKAKNYPFSKKKEEYGKSDIKLTNDLTSFKKWDAEEVNKRTENLFKLATKIWSIYPEKV